MYEIVSLVGSGASRSQYDLSLVGGTSVVSKALKSALPLALSIRHMAEQWDAAWTCETEISVATEALTNK